MDGINLFSGAHPGMWSDSSPLQDDQKMTDFAPAVVKSTDDLTAARLCLDWTERRHIRLPTGEIKFSHMSQLWSD